MARKKNKKGRLCPRCNSEIAILMRMIASNTAVAIARCTHCGRSWGVGCVEMLTKTHPTIMQGYAAKYRKKWDAEGIGNL